MSVQKLSESYLSHYYWHKNGDGEPWRGTEPQTVYDGVITAQATAGNFDADNRGNAEVELLSATKKVIIKLPPGVVSIELRFRADGTAADRHVLPIFAAAGEDHYDLVDTLTLDQGAQLYSGIIYFIDTVASAGEKWLTTTKELSSTTNNIGRFTMNMHGYDRLWIVASTLDLAGGSPSAANLYVDWKQL